MTESDNKHSILYKISSTRPYIMCIAIFWIVLFHSRELFSNVPIYIKFPFISMGWGGVELFMLLSGFSIYFSLNKDNDETNFYIKRVKRLLPAIPIIILYAVLVKDYSFQSLVGYVTNLNYFSYKYLKNFEYSVFWFIPAITIFYTISPILFNILNKHFSKKLIITLLLISLAVSIPFWGQTMQINCAGRFPIYLIGLILGYCYCNKIVISKKFITSVYFMAVAAFILLIVISNLDNTGINLFNYGVQYYLLIFIALGLCFIIADIFYFLKNIPYSGFLLKILSLIGNSTLEIYLIEALIMSLHWDSFSFLRNPITRILSSLFVGILYAYLYKFIKSIFYTCKKII